MKRLKVTHYLQDPCYCTVAACAAEANYYNPDITYEDVKKIADNKISKKISEQGLESPKIGMLLNEIGFYKVTLITSDFDWIDYNWSNFGRKKMIKTLEHSASVKKDSDERASTRSVIKWLKNFNYDNNLIISHDFGKYIRQFLNRKKPVFLTFNWTMLMKFAKVTHHQDEDPFNGTYEEHAVVANGYDDKGVWVVDSHHKFYKYRRKKYRRGFYKISWENLMTCIGQGDVFLAEEYYITK